MTIFIFAWIFIGSLVNLFIHYRNADNIATALSKNQLNPVVLLLTGFINHIVWPLALYLELTSRKL